MSTTAKLVEFFAVVGRSTSLAGRPSQDKIKQINESTSCNGIAFSPCILTQFPANAEETSSIHPKAICQFCFPRGLELSSSEKPPTNFTSILTDGSGRRHYVVVLTLTEQLTTLYRTLLFLGITMPDTDTDTDTTKKTNKLNKPNPPWLMDPNLPVYCPRALCIISRYPFLQQFDVFLKQLVRISLSSAPVPIERYMANFCAETPVPPRGMTSVQVTVADLPLRFQRPPPNQLPMIEPECFNMLFRSLSIENVVLVWSCLLLEYKTVLCSDSISTMTPTSLALLSLLFPFTWCGIYIPVLPQTLLDVIEAPVPFLVGVDGSYLRTVSAQDRPEGVIFVNLDTNEVFLGIDDETGQLREPPILPKHDCDKLMKHLNSLKEMLPDVEFCQHGPSTDFAFVEQVDGFEVGIPCVPTPIETFAIESGIISNTDKGSRQRHVRNCSTIGRTQSQDMSGQNRSHRTTVSKTGGLILDREESSYQDDGFVPMSEIRAGFLRFQTAVFKNYKSFIDRDVSDNVSNSSFSGAGNRNNHTSTTELFDVAKFITQFDRESQLTMERVIATQHWSSFLQQRIDQPWEESEASVEGDAVRYFDEQITAKMNRSVFSTKRKTPFLDDTRWDVTDAFTVPLPSTQKLPISDNGDDRYLCDHGRFPDLLRNDNLKNGKGKQGISWYGNIRTPRQLTQIERESTASGEVRNVLNRINTVAHLSVGKRMTRSDYDQHEVEQWEAEENDRRLSEIDFTNGYDVSGVVDFTNGYQDSNPNKGEEQVNHKKGNTGGSLRRKSDYEHTADLVTSIQSMFRGHCLRKKLQQKIQIDMMTRNSQAKNIQRAWRRRVHYLKCVVLIQSIFRTYPERQTFMWKRRCCVQIQSVYRGRSRRIESLRKRCQEVISLRKIILQGWSECAVPLLQRSQFWKLTNVEAPSYLDVGIHRDEIHWLSQKRQQYGLPVAAVQLSSTASKSTISSVSPPSYPNEYDSLLKASKALKISRKNLYFRLKGKKGYQGLDKSELKKYFECFGISKLKKRKQKVSQMIWSPDEFNTDICDSSSNVVLACIEDTDMDWVKRWRAHRVRVNILLSLRASLVGLRGRKKNKKEVSMIEMEHRRRGKTILMVLKREKRRTNGLDGKERKESKT